MPEKRNKSSKKKPAALNEMRACLDKLIKLYLDPELFDTFEYLLALAEKCEDWDFGKWSYKGKNRISYIKALGLLNVPKYREGVTLVQYIRKLKQFNKLFAQQGRDSAFSKLGEAKE